MGKKLNIISLTAYSLIILKGQMIGLPFIFWLIFTSFNFGNNDQIFASLGLIGLLINFTKLVKHRIVKILCFILMISPIIRRLSEVPIEKFNYLAFQIPLLIFVMCYLFYITQPSKN